MCNGDNGASAAASEGPPLPLGLDRVRSLIARYEKAGPRYTSYPTSPNFSADFDREQALERWRTASADLSLYLHVPYCVLRCLYCGCHTLIRRDRSLGSGYVDTLLDELRLIGQHTDVSRPLRQLALGGGTPTYLLPEDMERLFRGVREQMNFAEGAELSIEIDPREIEPEYIDRLAALGINRFSFGVQDINPAVMKAIGRCQDDAQVEAAIGAVRRNGPWPVNFDIMYGLPLQTAATFHETVGRIVDLGPDRIALFGYAHVPWLKKHQRGIERHDRPDADQRLRLYLQAKEQLEAAGYVTIGLDHFARPEDALAKAWKDGSLHRNFMGYTTQRGLDLLAGGVSGISLVNDAYLANEGDVNAWREQIGSGELPWRRGLLMAGDDALRGEVIESVMCQFRVDKKVIEQGYNISFDDYFADARLALEPLRNDGLVQEDDQAIEVTEDGRLFVRNVAMVFDRYLKAGDGRFSQTV